MQEKDIYKEALLKINENSISDAQVLLMDTKSYQNQELLGILCCIKGDFNTAENIFTKLSKIKEEKKISEYLEYLKKTIRLEYLPLFNNLISNIKSHSNSSIEDTIKKLEGICKNTELYSLATMFFLRENDMKKAKTYYGKLKSLDNSDTILEKIDFYFNKKKFDKKIKFLCGALAIVLIGLGSTLYKNNSLKNTINKKNIEISSNKKIKDEEVALLNQKLAEKENKNLKAEEIPKENKLLSDILPLKNNELYNVALRRMRQNNFGEATKIFDMLNLDQLPEYKKREVIFQKARAYDKLNDKEKELESYREYLRNSEKKEYELYLKIVQEQIRKLDKGSE